MTALVVEHLYAITSGLQILYTIRYTTRHDWQSCIHDWKIHDTIDKRNKTGLSGIKHKYGEIKRKREWIKPGYAGIKPG